MSFPRRGEIYLVAFDPALRHEIKKTRPALVIQNDIGNRHSSVTIVAAITSKLSPAPYPIDVTVQPTKGNGPAVESVIQLGQIRSIDARRLVKRLGVLDPATMQRVDEAIKISLGLISF